MIHFYRVVFIAVFALNTTLAQSKDEKLVSQAIERLRVAMMQPDSVELAALVSEDLEYVHSSGTVRSKQGFIDEFMKRQTDVSNVVFSDQTIKISGKNAIVRHCMMADSRKVGYPPVIDIIVLMVWRKEKGQWKMLARQRKYHSNQTFKFNRYWYSHSAIVTRLILPSTLVIMYNSFLYGS